MWVRTLNLVEFPSINLQCDLAVPTLFPQRDDNFNSLSHAGGQESFRGLLVFHLCAYLTRTVLSPVTEACTIKRDWDSVESLQILQGLRGRRGIIELHITALNSLPLFFLVPRREEQREGKRRQQYRHNPRYTVYEDWRPAFQS